MATAGKSGFDRYLDWMERVGNKLPDPMMMFIWMTVFILVLSAILSATGYSAVNPVDGKELLVRNMLSVNGIRYFFSKTVFNFVNFAPLGYVLVALTGAAVAEKSGLLATVFQKLAGGAKGWVVTALVIFVSLNASVACDAAIVILPPLAAILFMAAGKRSVLGLYVSFGAVAAGFSSSIFLSSLDASLTSITQDAARLLDPDFSISPACNYYFLVVSTLLLTTGGTLMVEKYLIKRYPVTQAQLVKYEGMLKEVITESTPGALRKAGFAALAVTVVMALMCIPFGGRPAILAGDDGRLLSSGSPFSFGMVLFITFLLLVPGIVYGSANGRYTKGSNVRKDIEAGFAEMGGYVFICLVISIFVNFFAQSNIGAVFSIRCATGLKNIGFNGIPLLLAILLVSALINLFMGSASAKWAVLSQVFVPMMMLMGFSPALTQIVYRIGDSITNPISPLFPYVPILLGTVNKYYKDAGMGTIISNMLPISLTFAVIWILQLIVWYLFNLPLGPGAYIR